MGEYLEILEEAINKAEEVSTKYLSIIKDPLKYRCDILLAHIAYSEDIMLDSYAFTGDLCGLLHVDEFEKTLVYNSKHSSTRRNFTIAHELGHYFLHLEKRSQFADRTKDLIDGTIVEFEIQANAFASHLILPESILEAMLSEKFSFFRIAKASKISYEALYWRIINHLKKKYVMTKEDALLIADDYKDMSILSSKNLAHHNLSMIFTLSYTNFLTVLERRKSGETGFNFKRDASGNILGIY